jgi:hypothetical protein
LIVEAEMMPKIPHIDKPQKLNNKKLPYKQLALPSIGHVSQYGSAFILIESHNQLNSAILPQCLV